MDLMTIGDVDGERKVFIMWGDKHGLECEKNLVTISNISSEPLVFDYNNDFISDLLTVDKAGERKVYVFSKDRTFHETSLHGGDGSQLKAEHGNSYVDVTGDGSIEAKEFAYVSTKMAHKAGGFGSYTQLDQEEILASNSGHYCQ